MLLPAVPPVFNELPTPPVGCLMFRLAFFDLFIKSTCAIGCCGSCTTSGAGSGLGISGAGVGLGKGGAGLGGGGALGAPPPTHIINSPFVDVTTQPLNVVLLET